MRNIFDSDWLFAKGDFPEAFNQEYDDSWWRALNVPHDWSIEGDYSRDNNTGKRGGFLPAGIGWYRKYFDVPEDWYSKEVYVEFDGIYMNSEVWINGNYLGKRPYGYIWFKYELTPYLKSGKNVLAIRVDNFKNPSSRWYSGSGIYRHVWINVKERLHFVEEEVFAYSSLAKDDYAKLSIEYEIKDAQINCSSSEIEVEAKLFDPSGLFIGKCYEQVKEKQEKNNRGILVMDVENPRLWSPENPELYTIELSIKAAGQIQDTYSFKTGIRYLKFDKDEGFFINGNNVKLKGVCIHQDIGPLGAAVPDKVLEKRLLQLKEIGCNAIRTGHHPLAPEFYDMCDRLGFMVADEIFDGWRKKEVFDYGALYYKDWWQRDVEDFVTKNRNHPCIIMWSLGNETGREDINGMTELFHKLDPTRPVTGGEVHFGVDIAGFNGKAEQPGTLAEFKQKYPESRILLTEYPHTLQTRGFYRTKVLYRDYEIQRHEMKDLMEEEVFDDYSPDFHPLGVYNSSYDNHYGQVCIRDAWKMTRDTPYIMGQFIWTAFDYMGESYSWPLRFGSHGVFDNCGFKKDAYYLYRSLWTNAPVIHILPHWTHPKKTGVKIPVWVYTNCESVELFLNGKSLGFKELGEAMNLEWIVEYAPGVLRAEGRFKDEIVIDEVKTAGVPDSILLQSDTTELNPDAIDIAQVSASILDMDGILVPSADNRIYFRVVGSAILKALDNGDPADLEPHYLDSRKVFHGLSKAFIQSTAECDGALMVAAGILGETYFEKETQVLISVNQLQVQKGIKSREVQDIKIYYTSDGSKPNKNSRAYNGPFKISGSMVIKALVVTDDTEILMEQEFVLGKKRYKDSWKLVPKSCRLFGEWIGENEETYYFHENGIVDCFKAGTKINVCNWWYDDFGLYRQSIGGLADDESDNWGELNYTWYAAKLRLIDTDLLRLTDRSGISYIRRKNAVTKA